jgi:hypothetical protein
LRPNSNLCLCPAVAGWPSYNPAGTGFPFSRLLRLAGLRWRYANLPPRTGLSCVHFQIPASSVEQLEGFRRTDRQTHRSHSAFIVFTPRGFVLRTHAIQVAVYGHMNSRTWVSQTTDLLCIQWKALEMTKERRTLFTLTVMSGKL